MFFILIQKGQNYKITVHLRYTCMIYRHKEALIVSLGELKIISLIVVGSWGIA
jgi:hypothetical protein